MGRTYQEGIYSLSREKYQTMGIMFRAPQGVVILGRDGIDN